MDTKSKNHPEILDTMTGGGVLSMTYRTNAPVIVEIWMELKDRTLLAELMQARDISARQLAKDAGWKSHTYLQRLIRGEVKTLQPEPAARIAYRLDVPFNLLFVTRVSEKAEQSDRKERAA